MKVTGLTVTWHKKTNSKSIYIPKIIADNFPPGKLDDCVLENNKLIINLKNRGVDTNGSTTKS